MMIDGLRSLISRCDASAILGWLETRRWQALAVTLSAVLLLHGLIAAITIRNSNTDWRPSDQLAEVYLAHAARGDFFPDRSDGVRHPLWSWMAGHLAGNLYGEGPDKTAFFLRGGRIFSRSRCISFLFSVRGC